MLKKIRPFILIFSLITALISCVKGQKNKGFDMMLNGLLSNSVPQLNSDSLYTLINNNKVIHLLDTREKEEYKVSHLPNATYVGYDNFSIANLKFNKNDTIVLYCSVGYRSEKIGEQLKKQGYKNVFNLRGGIFDWANSQKPLESDLGQTQKVHGYSKTWGVWVNDKTKIVYE